MNVKPKLVWNKLYPFLCFSFPSYHALEQSIWESSYPSKCKKEPPANIYYFHVFHGSFSRSSFVLIFEMICLIYNAHNIHSTKYYFLLISKFVNLTLEGSKLIFPFIHSCEKHIMILRTHAGHRSLDIYTCTFFIP